MDEDYERVAAAWRRDVGEGRDGLCDRLIGRYREEARRYHGLSHIEHMLRLYETHVSLRPLPLTLAIWYHDAIYVPEQSDNEERSADLARTELREAGIGDEAAEEVARLVLVTKTHEPNTEQGEILCDLDLAILGAGEAAYERYANGIRQEYAWVPDEQYRAGRTVVLTAFLERESIYRTPEFREILEDTARANLTRELADLRERYPCE